MSMVSQRETLVMRLSMIGCYWMLLFRLLEYNMSMNSLVGSKPYLVGRYGWFSLFRILNKIGIEI